ncbi:globin domain-containing protein [Calidifontibacillus erzurumensis]|uniref:Globin n=1 Tax=Calidifontibacillus erzurumensis TaxID=2741433 RepID=A0A8J8GD15_9BACI|nr:globin [Calidifontibacillus erzurumensis]NSL50906.1 globin [Calidifontibacillus erzurumensis]
MEFKTPYELIGGAETIQKLVEAFYPKVFSHPDLKPLFQGDMSEIMRKQKMFLTQFLGGPTLYSDEFGPPAMRARHMPFEITPTRRKAWLACMREAMDEIGLEGPIRNAFYERLEQVATIMVNTPDPS